MGNLYLLRIWLTMNALSYKYYCQKNLEVCTVRTWLSIQASCGAVRLAMFYALKHLGIKNLDVELNCRSLSFADSLCF